MKTTGALGLIVACLASTTAQAQLPPIIVSSQPYQSLTGATVLSYTLGQDEGALPVPLPFTFPYFGQNYTQVFPSINGFLTFGTGCTSGSTCYSTQAFPNVAPPNAVVAGLWDDMEIGASTQIRYVASPSEVTIEWYRLIPYFSQGPEVTFSITLSASGAIAIHHGTMQGAFNSWVVGFENPTGTLGANLLPCGATCTQGNFVPNQLFTIGQPAGVDLTVSSVTIANFVTAMDGNLTFTVNSTLRNSGLTAGNNFLWRAYLSRDQQLDLTATDGGADVQVAQGGPESLPGVDGGVSLVAVSGNAATTTAPPSGEYYVLVQVDPTDVVVEASEANNVGSTVAAFAQGVDLVATSVSGPALTGAGNTENFTINFFNRGTASAGVVGFRILLSLDQVLDPGDLPIHTGTRTVSGGQTISEVVPVVIPLNAPMGARYALLQLDPAGAVLEANELNNVVASAALIDVRRADLVADAAALLDPITSLPTTTARFGAALRATVTFRNMGGANATNFRVALVLSRDTSLSLLVDTWVCDQVVPLLVPPSPSTQLTLDCTLPLADAAMVPFTSGAWYLFALVDGSGVVAESNEANNLVQLGPVTITAPGPDLTVTSLTTTATAGVGEVIPVARTLRNAGNVAAPAATYRYFASADPLITAGDVALQLAGGAVEGSVTLAAGATDSATDLVALPAGLPPGDWYLGCIVDFGGAVTEADEQNNTLASALVPVVGSSLSIATSQLPDGVQGFAYGYQLIARGGRGLTGWTLASGALPAGLSLDSGGLISGAPTSPSVAGFTVRVSDPPREATAQLVLRVLPALAPVEITTTSAPPLISDPAQLYQLTLAAAGGTQPYSWRVVMGTLPANLSLTPAGVISGSAAADLPESTTRVTFEVEDAAGARAQRTLVFRVVAPGSLVLQTRWLPDGLVGQDYAQQLLAATGDGRPHATPLRFTATGVLPDGVTLSDAGALAGRPARAGTFELSVTVEDAWGRRDTGSLTLRIYPARLTVFVPPVATVLRVGDSFAMIVTTQPASTAEFTLASGQLPPGVTLQAGGGLSGTLTTAGRFDFVLEATDATGASGLGAITLDVQEKGAAGCSSSGGLTPFALLALGALVLLRRRGAGLTLALVLVPLAARAQYQVVTTPAAYQPLINGAVVSAASPVALPFAMPFFDTTFNSVAMSQYGYLAIGGASATYSSNQNVPHTSTVTVIPAVFIAPWWDVLTTPLSVTNGYRHQLTGTAPFRVMAFEWNAVGANAATSRISFQVQLHETGRIRFLYSTTLPGTVSASVGLQKALGVGLPALACASSASCTSSSYPAGQAIDFFTPPELEISARAAPQTGYAGVAFPQSATVRNRGGADALGVVVRFFLSTDAVLDGADLLIGDSAPRDIPAGAAVAVTSSLPLPAAAAVGPSFVIARVDPANLIVEQVETNNVGAPLPVTIAAPIADLLPLTVTAPATAQAGAMVSVSRVVRNAGNASAAPSPYAWYLSDNAALSVSDRRLAVGTVPALAAQADDPGTESLLIPADVAAGTYWLGLCVNYDALTSQFGAPESSQVNNCAPAAASTMVSAGALAISTTLLPPGAPNVPYGTRLIATGGDGTYAWSSTGGTMPAGMMLTAQGDLQGVPESAGSFVFSAQVTSGGASVTASLTLVVVSGRPLAIPDQPLPAAQLGRDYSIDLIATGGLAPYGWALAAGSTLPTGLTLSPGGSIAGRASLGGVFAFTVAITDGEASTARKDLTLTVIDPQPFRLATTSLTPATLGQSYLQLLGESGGQPPYTFALVKFQELPQGPTDEPGPVVGDGTTPMPVPDVLGLSLEGSALAGTPARVGQFALSFKATDGAGAGDTVALVLEVGTADPLLISTPTLPDAVVGEPYLERLESGGVAATYVVPCIKQPVTPTRFECALRDPKAQLPPGLFLAVDGTLAGTPVEAGADTTFSFLVKAVDAQGRQDVRALSIKVVAPKKAQGCSSTGLAPLALLLALFSRRRRITP